MQERPVLRAGVLGDDRFLFSLAIDGDRAGFLVVDRSQRNGLLRFLRGSLTGAGALRAARDERREDE